MFLLECHGLADKFCQSKSSFIQKEINYDNCEESDDEKSQSYQTLILFKNIYNTGSALAEHSSDLFDFARKYFQILNQAALNDGEPIIENEYSDNGFLRENILSLFVHIRSTLLRLDSDEESLNDEIFLTSIKEYLLNFRIMLQSIDTLPNFVIQNCTSEIGNQCSFASFHIYHLYLELLWLNFIIMVKLLSTNEDQNILLETETEAFATENMNKSSNFNTEFEKEIDWLMYNMISLSIKSYDQKGSESIFPCSCAKEMWFGLQIYLERQSSQNKCANFWPYYNNIMMKFVLEANINNDVSYSCIDLYTFRHIKCNEPQEFSLCLLLKLSRLQQYEFGDDSRNASSLRISANFEHLEYIITKITTSETSMNEENLRIIMKQIIKLSMIWSEPKHEIITLLWEYFHKHLNSVFSVESKDDDLTAIFSPSVDETIADLKSRLSITEVTSGNSFQLFNALLGAYLKKSLMNNQLSLCQKIKGRILPKFTLNKILALNEYGLKNFTTIYFTMAMATDLKDICTKLQGLLAQIPINNLQLDKKKIITMTHLTILYLYIENKYSIAKAALPIMNLMNSCSGLRDSDSLSLVNMTLKGCLDVLNASSDFKNEEYVLIDSWIVKYLTVCNLSDTYNIIETFSSLLSKLRILCSYQIDFNQSVTLMVDALFTHILNCTKTLYSNGTSVLQLAELSFNFLKFKLDTKICTKKYGSFEDMLNYFLHIENADDQVTRHLLMLILQDDEMLQSMENENEVCQSLLIQCWIKCTLIAKDNDTDDDNTHLMLLICQLREFAALNITPTHGNVEQKNLCKFFYAISNAWHNIQDTNKKLQFKKQVNQYLKNIDKYAASAIKTPPSSQYVVQIFMTIANLFLHCSSIIYTRADPSCLLHGIISSIILPPQLFMEKKVHSYTVTGICKSWSIFMKGLYLLDYKNDAYIDKVMKDMILQYLPYFAEKTLSTKDESYIVVHKMIPNECSVDLELERYILEKIAVNFITCRGKQNHVHSTKALSVIQSISYSANMNLLLVIVSCTLLPIFEQLMFSDVNSPNKKIAKLIVSIICNQSNTELDIRNEVRDILVKTCQKHLAFNSVAFFKLVSIIVPLLGVYHVNIFLASFKAEVSKIEKMRGVGFDHGLRNSISEIETSIENIK